MKAAEGGITLQAPMEHGGDTKYSEELCVLVIGKGRLLKMTRTLLNLYRNRNYVRGTWVKQQKTSLPKNRKKTPLHMEQKQHDCFSNLDLRKKGQSWPRSTGANRRQWRRTNRSFLGEAVGGSCNLEWEFEANMLEMGITLSNPSCHRYDVQSSHAFWRKPMCGWKAKAGNAERIDRVIRKGRKVCSTRGTFEDNGRNERVEVDGSKCRAWIASFLLPILMYVCFLVLAMRCVGRNLCSTCILPYLCFIVVTLMLHFAENACSIHREHSEHCRALTATATAICSLCVSWEGAVVLWLQVFVCSPRWALWWPKRKTYKRSASASNEQRLTPQDSDFTEFTIEDVGILRDLCTGARWGTDSLKFSSQACEERFSNSCAPYLPLDVYNLFLDSMQGNTGCLRKVLGQPWAKEWWAAQEKEYLQLDDAVCKRWFAKDLAERLARITFDNMEKPEWNKSDGVRRNEVCKQGKRIGTGEVHGNNDCFVDSFLQLLSFWDFVPESFGHDIARRRDICGRARRFLNENVDEGLWPRCRTETGEVADATDAEHARAFLEHAKHGPVLLPFLLKEVGCSLAEVPLAGIRLTVYTRFDSESIPADTTLISLEELSEGRDDAGDKQGTQCHSEETKEDVTEGAEIILEFYNDTGTDFVGYHYSPIFPRVMVPRPVMNCQAGNLVRLWDVYAALAKSLNLYCDVWKVAGSRVRNTLRETILAGKADREIEAYASAIEQYFGWTYPVVGCMLRDEKKETMNYVLMRKKIRCAERMSSQGVAAADEAARLHRLGREVFTYILRDAWGNLSEDKTTKAVYRGMTFLSAAGLTKCIQNYAAGASEQPFSCSRNIDISLRHATPGPKSNLLDISQEVLGLGYPNPEYGESVLCIFSGQVVLDVSGLCVNDAEKEVWIREKEMMIWLSTTNFLHVEAFLKAPQIKEVLAISDDVSTKIVKAVFDCKTRVVVFGKGDSPYLQEETMLSGDHDSEAVVPGNSKKRRHRNVQQRKKRQPLKGEDKKPTTRSGVEGDEETEVNPDKEQTVSQNSIRQVVTEVECMPEVVCPDPRRKLERLIRKVAHSIKKSPTLPDCSDKVELSGRFIEAAGVSFPPKHCAFEGCKWWGETDGELKNHLKNAHYSCMEDFRAAVNSFTPAYDHEEALWGVYTQAVSVRAQEGAPIAGNSIDRRCLRAFDAVVKDDNVAEAICFLCACTFPHVGTARHKRIRWMPAMYKNGSTQRFLHLTQGQTEAFLGLDSYKKRYGDPSFVENMEPWLMGVPFDEKEVQILACGEDRICSACEPDSSKLCDKCRVPVCHRCEAALMLQTPKMPEGALANDMLTGYISRFIYEKKVTVVELICASVCLTTLVCFSLEVEYGGNISRPVHMQRHRQGARGNVTCFPLPVEDLFVKLLGLASKEEQGDPPELPRTGEELANIVKIILKGSNANIGSNVQQGIVRRDIVIELILGAKQRGHRSYQFVDEELVRQRAASLPENGIPPEIVHFFFRKR